MDKSDIKTIYIKNQNSKIKNKYAYRFRGDHITNWAFHIFNVIKDFNSLNNCEIKIVNNKHINFKFITQKSNFICGPYNRYTKTFDKNECLEIDIKNRKSTNDNFIKIIKNEFASYLKKWNIFVEKYQLNNSKFNVDQLDEIISGFDLENNIDVSIYAKPEFYWHQMSQIRKGLKHNLDVSQYADPKFNEDQMIQIYSGLEYGLDVSKYANPKFDSKQMEQIRLKLFGNKYGIW